MISCCLLYTSLGAFAFLQILLSVLQTLQLVLFLCKLCLDPVSYTHLDVYKRQVSIRSSISGALICRKDTAQNLSAIVNFLASPKRKEEGAIKSWTDRPEGASQLLSLIHI